MYWREIDVEGAKQWAKWVCVREMESTEDTGVLTKVRVRERERVEKVRFCGDQGVWEREWRSTPRVRERERERVREMMPIITFAGKVKIEINFSPVENFRLFV